MKKTNIVIAIIVTAILIASGVLLFKNDNSKESSRATEVANEKETMIEDGQSGEIAQDTVGKEHQKYGEYSREFLGSSSNARRVLFFYASWCPTCRPADNDFKDNITQIPDDVTVIRVNYNDSDTDDEEKDLAKQYGITYQHTFVQIDSNGKEIAKWNGGKLQELLQNIK